MKLNEWNGCSLVSSVFCHNHVTWGAFRWSNNDLHIMFPFLWEKLTLTLFCLRQLTVSYFWQDYNELLATSHVFSLQSSLIASWHQKLHTKVYVAVWEFNLFLVYLVSSLWWYLTSHFTFSVAAQTHSQCLECRVDLQPCEAEFILREWCC